MPDLGPAVAGRIDGGPLHLQHGPIDLLIECDGTPEACGAARRAAIGRFDDLLDGIVDELALLRTRLEGGHLPSPKGAVATRMVQAAAPHCGASFITPMAAVAGSVADEIGAAMSAAASLDRWMVNNGGDIAVGIGSGQSYRVGLVVDPRRAAIEAAVELGAESGIGGVATSGRHGRSLSLGIADAVTVFAADAAAADAAATIIANRVDIGPHREITRRPAHELDPDSDLGDARVTLDVGVLTTDEIGRALDNGLAYAEQCVDSGLIAGAVLYLAGSGAATGSELFAGLGEDASLVVTGVIAS